MRFLVGLLLSTQIGLASAWPLQERQTQRDRFFLEPPETVLTVIASQPSCGLEFTKALVIHGVEGGGGYVFQVRNRGPKGVRSYQIATVTSSGVGADWSYRIKNSEAPFQTGEVRPKSLENLDFDLVPLTEELRNKHGLRGPLRGIVVFMVVKVTYVDGSEYNARAEYQALTEYFVKNQFMSPK
jgi:hypothetical protein